MNILEYRNNTDCFNSLGIFFDYCKDIAIYFRRGVTINNNKSFYELKEIFAPNNFTLGYSTDLRDPISTLQYYDNNEWPETLYEFFHFDVTCVNDLIGLRNQQNLDEWKHNFSHKKESIKRPKSRRICKAC